MAESIPLISQDLQILAQKAFNVAQLFTIISVILLQRHVGVKPEFGALIFPVHVLMLPLLPNPRYLTPTLGGGLSPFGKSHLTASISRSGRGWQDVLALKATLLARGAYYQRAKPAVSFTPC